MERCKVAVILTLALTVTAILALSEVFAGSSVYLYLYGRTGCPACRALDEFLRQAYPGRYYFCKTDLSKVCENNHDQIVSTLVSKGVSSEHLMYIPQTYVVRNGRYLVAVVIGAIRDPQFWENITVREPQERVLVVALVKQPSVYEIPMTYEEQRELIAVIARREQGADLQYIIALALIALGATLVTYAVLVRRR